LLTKTFCSYRNPLANCTHFAHVKHLSVWDRIIPRCGIRNLCEAS
jgi:hypothetical protein